MISLNEHLNELMDSGDPVWALSYYYYYAGAGDAAVEKAINLEGV